MAEIDNIPLVEAEAEAFPPVDSIAPEQISTIDFDLLARNPADTWAVPLKNRASLVTIFRCYLTGDGDGLDDIELPISSWQARARDGDPSYLSVVVPAVTDYEEAITTRTNGDLILKKGVRLGDGTEQLEEILTVDYENVQVSQGARNESIIVTGHRTITSSAPKERAVGGVSFYCLQADGKRRVRALMDLFLRCGDTCIYGDGSNDYFVVGAITYWASAKPPQSFMEASEA
jgi:hypothetical protein